MLLSSLKPLAASIFRTLLSSLPWKPAQVFPNSKPKPSPKPLSTTTTPNNENNENNNNKNFLDKIPPGAWDSHMHILDPNAYPLSPTAHYTPSPALLPSALTTLTSLHLPNLVIIQPSIYGHDNSCLLSALRTLGPQRGRGVVAFHISSITEDKLREWHALGVRGVRINLQSVGLGKSVNAIELAEMLKRYADVIRPFGWVLQLYVPLEMAVLLEDIVPGLGVTVCLDHFGSPDLSSSSISSNSTLAVERDPYLVPGFRSLVKLLEQGSTYVKMSAPYRLTDGSLTSAHDLEPMGRELLRAAGMKRVVFASDWPHTRFEGLDIKPFVKTVVEWCEWDERMIERVFRGNAEELWDVECREDK